ncbi:hypothetical protein HG531_003841 [Fusarium graminearum]|nr:hypothetical protein HG531_003841 [Fusarium graminearum]
MVQDLNGKVSLVLFSSLEMLPRITLSKRETKIVASNLSKGCGFFHWRSRPPSERVQVCDVWLHVWLTGTMFEPEGVFEGNSIASDKLQHAKFLDQNLTGILIASTVIVSMDPDNTAQGLRRSGQGSPVSTALTVSFVGSRRTERKAETDYKTKNGKKNRIDAQIMDFFRDDGDSGCPAGDEQKREDQRRHDGAV